MLNGLVRVPITRVITPLARAVVRVGISPAVVTWSGAIGAIAASALLIPSGHLFAASLFVGGLALLDLLDGTMARISGQTSDWGAFLDSNLDRVTDAAIFASLATYYATRDHTLMILALIALVAGFQVSYAKARAESLGLKCTGGLMERAERLIVVLAVIGLTGLGVRYVAGIGLWLLVIGGVFTFGQRLRQVHIESHTR
ncbi:MAG TPA: CDP-alcohol phosphatidyltransferase family protein [Candidatus Nanopelagicaceae bacterium]|nr:CDP-alcohol phosphatidyltransferase family protein [Candidatus Nanopelagicaceae bacterium]